MEKDARTKLAAAMSFDDEAARIANRLCIEDPHFSGLWNRYHEQAAQLRALMGQRLGSDDDIERLEQAHRHLWGQLREMIDSARRANSV